MRLQGVDHADGGAERVDGKIWVIVKVAEECDGEPIQS